MSSFTFADNKLGGRFTAIVDAIGAGHLRKAAGILNEVADDLNAEAEATTGLLAPDEPDEPVEWPMKPTAQPPIPSSPIQAAPSLMVQHQPTDTLSCSRGAHFFGPPDPVSGWYTCGTCGYVVVTPPGGALDTGAHL